MKKTLTVTVAALGLGACAGDISRGEGEPAAAQLFVDDMAQEHDLKPAGVGGADWGRRARPGYRHPPEGWSCANMWGQIYPAEGAGLPANVRVQIRNARLWAYSLRNKSWREAKFSVAVAGAAYALDFAVREKGSGAFSATAP